MPFLIYTKIMYKCDDDFWNRVKAYKRERGFETMNAAVTELLSVALVSHEKQKAGVIYQRT